MKDSIYTIPISEVFEPRSGCPLCALHQSLEERWVEYITGAAMMEPDVRVETNRRGFCGRHYEGMIQQRNRLSVALLLQTRLDYLDKSLEDEFRGKKAFRGIKSAPKGEEGCFVCGKIEGEFLRILDNLLVVWGREESFRELFREQEYLCMPHLRQLARACGGSRLKAALLAEFAGDAVELARRRLRPLKADIDAFCKLYDYRSAGSGQPSEEVASSIERSIGFLTGPGTPEE